MLHLEGSLLDPIDQPVQFQRIFEVWRVAEWLVRGDVEDGRLVDLFPEFEATATDFDGAIWLLYASRQHLSRRVRVVVDILKREIQERIGK